MCGIVGLHSRNAFVDPGIFQSMRDALSHRGPDDAGSWIGREGRLALGHRRLSIVDLSPGGHQPMERDGVQIVFNGEIYNHGEVRTTLAAQGAVFRTRSDTEVLLAAYLHWGEACLEHLDGMFAFCIYDPRRAILFLARDRAGEKPLYIARSPGRLAFASEVKALFADPAQPRRVDSLGLNWFLAYGMACGDASMISGVEKLPAAHAAVYGLKDESWRRWRYWDLPAAAESSEDGEVLADRLDVLLERSVRQRLEADVPVGVLLSGGLDSSLITAMAARTGRRVRTFTISFPGHARQDESPFAQLVANHFSTEHTVLPAEPAEASLLAELARQYDEPLGDSSQLPTLLVSRLIRRHATVALGGDGGDELFGGYVQYPWMGKHATVRRWVPGPVREMIAWASGRMMATGGRGRNYLNVLGGSMSRAYSGVNHFFTVRDRMQLLGTSFRSDPAPELAKAAACYVAYGWPGAAMAADFRTYMCDDILVKVDRASMLASLEVRAPWLSRDIIEFAYARVPNAWRVREGRLKAVPKILGRRLLPAALELERKQGFAIPIADWIAGPWGPFLKETLYNAPGWLLSRRVLERLFAAQSRGRRNGERIFALAMLELWRRAYDMKP